MRTAQSALLAALTLAAAGCSLLIDPESVPPPSATTRTPVAPRGACVATASGHQLCGDVLAPGGDLSSPSGHAVRGRALTGAPLLSSPQHRISRGAVTP